MILHWLDLETTGLDEREGHILEIGVITTSHDLVEQNRFHRVIGRSLNLMLPLMSQHVRTMHSESGLLDDMVQSPVSEDQAFIDLYRYMHAYEGTSIYLAGSGIPFDVRWLTHHTPGTMKLVHYRVLDVTSLRLAYEAQSGKTCQKGAVLHRAIPDCEAAIAEYRTFKVTNES